MMNNEKEYTVTLTLNELDTIGKGLENVIFKLAFPVIRKIEGQVNIQLKEEAPEIPVDTPKGE